MPSWIVQTMEYDLDLSALLGRYLAAEGAPFSLSEAACGVGVRLDGPLPLEPMSRALQRVLRQDMLPLALGRMIDRIPLPSEDRGEILQRAIQTAEDREDMSQTSQRLRELLSQESRLCLDGFLQFRMPETLLFWRLCMEEALSGLLMEREFAQVAQVLRLMLAERPPRCRSLRLCLHGDGVCSLSDGAELHMEYVDESGEGIVSLLVGMAPARLIVYDLSGGRRRELVEALTEIFLGRICLYTGDFT